MISLTTPSAAFTTGAAAVCASSGVRVGPELGLSLSSPGLDMLSSEADLLREPEEE